MGVCDLMGIRRSLAGGGVLVLTGWPRGGAMPDLTGVPRPPIEWTEEYRKKNFALVANATLSAPVEPTLQQQQHAAMAATILHLGARIEALERAGDNERSAG
jgi:hypothetical protein